MANIAGCKAIEAKCEELGWPVGARTALRIDQQSLMKTDAPTTFAWGVRPSGTDIFFIGNRFCLEGAQACQQDAIAVGREKQRYYWFDGEKLDEIDVDTLVNRLGSESE